VQLGRRITRTREGRFRVKIPSDEREILRSLPGQMREMLGTDHPALQRLFPPAYEDDPERSAEFDRLMREELLDHHRGHLEIMEATAGATELDEEQISAWMGAINGLRLALGTRLEVTEEAYDRPVPEDDPRYPAFALFFYLGWLEEQIVEALLAGVDPAGMPGAPAPPPPRSDRG
jgi:hypothetical protein